VRLQRARAPILEEGRKLGVAFRRQVPVGDCVADFVAPVARLIVEVDDRSHELKRAADARRDRDLGRLGYRVLRIPAEVVRSNPSEAAARIVATLSVAT
jgi:very-short-patch-repair endonuclease